MKTAAAKKPADPDRRAMLAKIHIAKKDMALEDASYRDMLEQLTGKRSAAKCSLAQLNDVLRRFKDLGWKASKRQPKRAGERRLADGGQAGKIRALWLDLYHLAETRDPSEDALAAFVAKTTGVDALQWIDAENANKAIKALRGWLRRIGFEFPDAERHKAIARQREWAKLPAAPAGFADKIAMLECQWQRLKASGAMEHAFFAALDTWCAKNYGPAAPAFLSPEDADKAIEKLGAWVRDAYRVES